MKTAPCDNCGRSIMRDGSVGLLVCSCGNILEFPADLEGPLRPAPDDKRWYGTTDERTDLAELNQPIPALPKKRDGDHPGSR